MKICIAILAVFACCSCGSAQDRFVGIPVTRFDSVYRFTGSFFDGHAALTPANPGQYISARITEVQVDVGKNGLQLSGRVDSIVDDGYGQHISLDKVSLVLGNVRQRIKDSLVWLNYAMDSAEQSQQYSQQESQRKLTSQERIEWLSKRQESAGQIRSQSIEIAPVQVFHPSPNGEFDIKGQITTDTWLVIAVPNGPAHFYMVGRLLR